MTRFAMALGYDGYPAFRRALRDLDGDGTGPDSPDNELQHAEKIRIKRRLIKHTLSQPIP